MEKLTPRIIIGLILYAPIAIVTGLWYILTGKVKLRDVLHRD